MGLSPSIRAFAIPIISNKQLTAGYPMAQVIANGVTVFTGLLENALNECAKQVRLGYTVALVDLDTDERYLF